jgi:hypothetical protein
LEALDTLTELIAERGQRGMGSLLDGEFPAAVTDAALPPPSMASDVDLDGIEFGPAMDDPIPLLHEVVRAPAPELPSREAIEGIVDELLDRRLAELREQLKRELFVELRKRFPHL